VLPGPRPLPASGPSNRGTTRVTTVADVVLSSISKVFDGPDGTAVAAVDDVTLHIADREFMILLGPSGCGKSTLLRTIAGLEEPTRGTVSIGGTDVTRREPVDRDVAMVFQSYALYPHKTVQANIEFPLKVRGVDKDERARQARTAADTLGLGEYLSRKPGQLSGGQRQRVALARAIVRRPAVFCMDEPLSNLDAKLRGETRSELVALHRELTSTFVYVTHDQVEAMTMGTRVAVMNRGRLEQVGTPAEVYGAPASVFVAQFIGTPPMNILPAGLAEPTDHIVGVRPEHVRLDDTSSIRGRVVLVEHLGHETLAHVRIERAGVDVVARLAIDLRLPVVGDEVGLRFAIDHRHQFHAGSGKRIGAAP
jgi:multiple sugar transport system ATP-binding protein